MRFIRNEKNKRKQRACKYHIKPLHEEEVSLRLDQTEEFNNDSQTDPESAGGLI